MREGLLGNVPQSYFASLISFVNCSIKKHHHYQFPLEVNNACFIFFISINEEKNEFTVKKNRFISI